MRERRLRAACSAGMVVCGGSCVDTQRDVDNCGGCGASCTGLCDSAVCDPTAKQVIALGGATPTALAADGTSVFFISSGTDIMQVDRDGSSPPVTIAAGQQGPRRLALDATSLYWGNSTGGGIWKATKGIVGAALVSPAASPARVAVDDANVYWIDSGSIYRAFKTGGSGTAIIASAINLAADGTCR
jgi:hypothetical protein